MNLGKNIKIARINKDLSQGDLAKKICVSQNYLCQIERGNNEPSLAVLQQIADALDTTVSDLMRENV